MSNISIPARGTGSAIDLGVAALAAGSIAFLAFAMPGDLFSSLVSATHIPDLVAAAAPPLGMKARCAVMGGAAIATFAAIWALMRSLDRLPSARPSKAAAEADAPKVRRADAHPDAPARRPLLAREDLGEPDMDVYELETASAAPFAPEPAEELAAWEPVAEPDPLPGRDPSPVFAAAPEPAPEPKLPRFLDAEVPAEPVRDPVVPPSRKRPFDGLAARLPDAPEPAREESINTLMQRLERGLSEREEPAPEPEPDLPPALHAASANPEASLSPEGVRHRLRSAISDLNQLANRG